MKKISTSGANKSLVIHKNTKEIDMATMMSAVDAFQPDVIVLARYMQIIFASNIMTGCANQFDTALRCTLIGVTTCK
jgi:folate-dependent phosphoribosylglycinamide formyltransferase PurN